MDRAGRTHVLERLGCRSLNSGACHGSPRTPGAHGVSRFHSPPDTSLLRKQLRSQVRPETHGARAGRAATFRGSRTPSPRPGAGASPGVRAGRTPEVAGVQWEGCVGRAHGVGRTHGRGRGQRAPQQQRGWRIHQHVLVWPRVVSASRSPKPVTALRALTRVVVTTGSGGTVYPSCFRPRHRQVPKLPRGQGAGMQGSPDSNPSRVSPKAPTVWDRPLGDEVETTQLRWGLTEDTRLPAWTRAVSWSEGQ